MNETLTKICSLNDVTPGIINAFTIDGKSLIVTKVKETYEVINGVCAHMGAPLAKGKLINESTIECPWHQAHYSLQNGSVIEGPHITKISIIDKLTKYIIPNVHHYDIQIIDNDLYIVGKVVKQQVRMGKSK